MIIRCYLLASSLARLIHRERGTARVVEGSFRTRSGQILSVQVENDVGRLDLVHGVAQPWPRVNRSPVPPGHADALLDVAEGRIAYERSRMVVAGREILVDRLGTASEPGRIVIEFDNEDQAGHFAPPQWFGPEITLMDRTSAAEGIRVDDDELISDAALNDLLDVLEGFEGLGPGRSSAPASDRISRPDAPRDAVSDEIHRKATDGSADVRAAPATITATLREASSAQVVFKEGAQSTQVQINAIRVRDTAILLQEGEEEPDA